MYRHVHTAHIPIHVTKAGLQREPKCAHLIVRGSHLKAFPEGGEGRGSKRFICQVMHGHHWLEGLSEFLTQESPLGMGVRVGGLKM